MFSIGGVVNSEPALGRRGRPQAAQAERNRARRRGVVLLVVIVCVAVATAVMFAIVKLAVLGRREVDLERYRAQALWLAESGADRAAARIAADPGYRGEEWLLPAEELGGRHAGRVQIEVGAAADAGGTLEVRVVADYPSESIERVRQSREFRLRPRR